AQRGIDAVRASGVRVVGDLSSLVTALHEKHQAAPDGDGPGSGAPARIDPRIGALAVSGVVEVVSSEGPLARLYPQHQAAPAPKRPPEQLPPDELSSQELLGVLAGRLRATLTRGRVTTHGSGR